jgi:hypothetical protein
MHTLKIVLFRKRRIEAAEPILEEFEKDLNKYLGGGNVKKGIKAMNWDELLDAKDTIANVKIVWKDNCAKGMKDGNSKCKKIIIVSM